MTTLTNAINQALQKAPAKMSRLSIHFTIPAKNGGTAEFETRSKDARGYWVKEDKEYALRFLKIKLTPSLGAGGWGCEFSLCPFQDGAKVGRRLSEIEVLEHADPEAITNKLAEMIERTGSLEYQGAER